MLEAEFRAKEQELLQALGELVAFLRSVGDGLWSPRFARWRTDLEQCIQSGAPRAAKQRTVRELQMMYGGGMGSFTDYGIHPDNGHTVAAGQVQAVNRQLMHLGDKVYRLSEIYQMPRYKEID